MNIREVEVLKKLLEYWNETPKHSDGSILGSMTTIPHPLAQYAYNLFIHTNYADTRIFPVLKEFEEQVFNGLREIYGFFETGLVTSGGSESNFLAILAAYRLRNTSEKIVVAPDTVHVSVVKSCDILSIKLVKIPVNSEPVDPLLVEDYVRKYKPFLIIITAGTTERGVVDPVKEVGEIASMYNVFLHVDAAYGGLIVPFLYKRGLLKKNLGFFDGVSSITVDFHKNGLTPIPSSLLLFRNSKFREAVTFPNNYSLSGYTFGILGTRPGGSVASIWTMWMLYGYDGFEKQALEMYENAIYLYEELSKLKDIIVYKPELPIVVFKHKYIHYKSLLSKLLEKGFYLYTSPSLEALRIVVMPHIKREHLNRFIMVLREVTEKINEYE
ncbi:MAG: aminotransferase class V-fold PLP-dependent enzyme [Desulfurococcaceae archaeon]